MKNIFFITIILSSLIISCSKESKSGSENKSTLSEDGFLVADSESETGILAYYDFIVQPADGFFGIKSYCTQATQNEERQAFLGGNFLDQDREAMPGGLVMFDNIRLSGQPEDGYTYGLKENQGADFYGQEMNIEINSDPDNDPSSGASESFYIPSHLSLNSPELNSIITTGTVVNWNADFQNNKNILIVLEYDPGFIENIPLAEENPSLISRSIDVSDNGSYTITSSDIEDFPEGSKVFLKIMRLNYTTLVAENGQTYSLYAYSGVDGLFTLQH